MKILLIFIFGLTITCSAQEAEIPDANSSKVVLDSITEIEVFTIEQQSSIPHKELNPYPIIHTLNGEVRSDYLIGEGTYWFAYPRYIVLYENGLLQGDITVWTNDNKLWCTGQYKQNKKVGLWKFYKNDTIAEMGNYDPQKDSSFIYYDWCDKFMDPSADYYGIDTASYSELMSPGILPWMNIWNNREMGRTGNWKFYNQEGVLIEEKDYK